MGRATSSRRISLRGTMHVQGRVGGVQPGVAVAASYAQTNGGSGRRLALRKAEQDDFQAYVAARMERWRRSAYLLCEDWHTADDLVLVTVANLFRNWHKVSGADNRDAFAQRVLTRCWLDERRRPWRRERLSERLPERGWTPAEQVSDRDSLAALLRSLAPRQRAVLVLRF
jgi:DNA-directed RNA polymerase specialized sigma24 family protein